MILQFFILVGKSIVKVSYACLGDVACAKFESSYVK